MCDEYEDERMVALWRALEEKQRLAMYDHEESAEAVPLTPAIPQAEPSAKAKPRPLSH